jgi:hypothetical protein
LVFLSGALALTVMLLTGCGGSDDRTKVEASLRDYVADLSPNLPQPFPIGSGPPRVQDKSCNDRHVTTKGGQVHSFHSATGLWWSTDGHHGLLFPPEGLALWSCVVTFRNSLALPVGVAMKGSEVVAVFPGASPDAPKQPPATVYQGGQQPQP